MWYLNRSSTAGAMLAAALVFAGCAGQTFGTKPSGAFTVPAMVTPNVSYRFLLVNHTAYNLEMESLGAVCMDQTIHGTILPHESKDVTVDTHNRNGCLFEVARFTTKFIRKADGHLREVQFSKRNLHPWETKDGSGNLALSFHLDYMHSKYFGYITH
jgi:hypothetical protein